VRGRLLAQQVKKNQMLSQWTYQTIPCIEMKEVPVILCPCVPPVGCTTLRSKHKIPPVISGDDAHQFQSVTTLDGGKKLDEVKWHTSKYGKGAKYTSGFLSYYIYDGYMFVTTKKKPAILTATALFEDIEAAYKYPSCCDDGRECMNILDQPFPLEGELFEAAIELSAQELIDWFNKNREDKTNDSSDNPSNESK
jgi:hypothetical protein